MTWIFIALQIALIAHVYANMLTKPGHLLGDVYGYLTGIANAYPWTEYVLKPVMLCGLCVSGQMMLWTMILYGWLHIEAVRAIIDGLFCLSLTIYTTSLLTKFSHD